MICENEDEVLLQEQSSEDLVIEQSTKDTINYSGLIDVVKAINLKSLNFENATVQKQENKLHFVGKYKYSNVDEPNVEKEATGQIELNIQNGFGVSISTDGTNLIIGIDEELQERIDVVENQIGGIENELQAVNEELAEHTNKINQNIENIGVNSAEIVSLNNKLTTDYYDKLSTYNKGEVNNLISTVQGLKFEIVAVLPTTDIKLNTIYLVPATESKQKNIYDEFIYINGNWEQIGTTAIDLSNYYTKPQVDEIIEDVEGSFRQDTEALQGQIDGIVGSVETLENNKADRSELEDYVEKVTYNQKINEIDNRIDEIELFKFPNATIIGEPTISNGQVSDFTENDYMQFPFIVDLKNRPFEIDFAYATGDNVTTQQNILDSYFGLALAIINGKGTLALSSNGSSWDIGVFTGNYTVLPNTTYYVKLIWDGNVYKTFIGTDENNLVEDIVVNSTLAPYPRTIFIGGSYGLFGVGTAHPFGGTINMNKALLKIDGLVVWQGMDDAGLSTRASVSLDNIDEAGKQVIKDQTQPQINAINQVIADIDEEIVNLNSAVANKQGKLTQPQLDATNSGITQTKVAEYDTVKQQYLKNATIDNQNHLTITKQDDTTVVFAGGSGGGTTVTVGGVAQATWDADTKADKTTVQNQGTIINSHTTSISNLQTNKADKTEIPTNTSELTNDSNFITLSDIPHGKVRLFQGVSDASSSKSITIDASINPTMIMFEGSTSSTSEAFITTMPYEVLKGWNYQLAIFYNREAYLVTSNSNITESVSGNSKTITFKWTKKSAGNLKSNSFGAWLVW